MTPNPVPFRPAPVDLPRSRLGWRELWEADGHQQDFINEALGGVAYSEAVDALREVMRHTLAPYPQYDDYPDKAWKIGRARSRQRTKGGVVVERGDIVLYRNGDDGRFITVFSVRRGGHFVSLYNGTFKEGTNP